MQQGSWGATVSSIPDTDGQGWALSLGRYGTSIMHAVLHACTLRWYSGRDMSVRRLQAWSLEGGLATSVCCMAYDSLCWQRLHPDVESDIGMSLQGVLPAARRWPGSAAACRGGTAHQSRAWHAPDAQHCSKPHANCSQCHCCPAS